MSYDHASTDRPRISRDFAHEERGGLMLAAMIRLAILSAVVAWLAVDLPMTGIAYVFELGVLSVYVAAGLAHLACVRYGLLLPWSVYGLFAFDIVFMGVAFTQTNPFVVFPDFEPTLFLTIPNFPWFFMFMLQAAFALTPRLVIWCGLWILAARLGQTAYIWLQGDFYTEAALAAGDWQARIDIWYDPQFLSVGARVTEAIFTAGMTAGLAAIVQRSRGLVLTRVASEKARENLARYFSPNVVDAVTTRRDELDRLRSSQVGVMFVDIKGFTGLCERMGPDEVAELLKRYYERLTQQVFAHNGTLDKFLGDGVMATFGTPLPRDEAPAEALECAFAIADDVARWNEERAERDERPVRIGVGLHWGPALIGNIGDARRLEYAVVGDTVNVASRVEGLTRELEAVIAVTDDCLAAIRERGDHALLERLEDRGDHAVKGRDKPVRVWSGAG